MMGGAHMLTSPPDFILLHSIIYHYSFTQKVAVHKRTSKTANWWYWQMCRLSQLVWSSILPDQNNRFGQILCASDNIKEHNSLTEGKALTQALLGIFRCACVTAVLSRDDIELQRLKKQQHCKGWTAANRDSQLFRALRVSKHSVLNRTFISPTRARQPHRTLFRLDRKNAQAGLQGEGLRNTTFWVGQPLEPILTTADLPALSLCNLSVVSHG